MSKGNIITVNGKISPDNLGVTLPHEHLVVGGNNTAQLYRKRYPPPTDPKIRSMLDEPVKLENLWLIRKEGFTYIDNLIIEDVDMISNDLLDYKKYGGTSVVDITPPSLGSDPTKVKQISDKTGLNIIYGLGFYIEAFHPEYVSRKTVKELTQEFLDIIENGYNNTNIRPGIIGEIGTSSPKTTPQEEKVLEVPWLGVVFKPKVSITLRQRLGPVVDLLEKALATGRCHIYEDSGRHTTSAPPILAGLSADICIHGHLCAGTAGLECVLEGLPTLLIDREGAPYSKLYNLKTRAVVDAEGDGHFMRHCGRRVYFG